CIGCQGALGARRFTLGTRRALGTLVLPAVATRRGARAGVGLGGFAAGLSSAVTIAVGTVAFATAFLAIVAALGARATAFGFVFRHGWRSGLGRAAQPVHQALEQTTETGARGRRRGRRGRRRNGSGLRRCDALDQRLGAGLDLGVARRPGHVGRGSFGKLEAGLDFFEARVVVTQPFDLVMRRFQVLI